ncbi:MAG: hypothetical protein U0168_29205 [Nannocystaceae bacterium]
MARSRAPTLLLATALLGAGGFALWRAQRGVTTTTVTATQAEIVQTLVTIGRVDPPAELVFVARRGHADQPRRGARGRSRRGRNLLVQMDAAEPRPRSSRPRPRCSRPRRTHGRSQPWRP